eukprot:CAMPEP_0206182044 /NCGR_PEP_ID=MMETSP1474-20131121/69220_1 /ASSEMBLY_ACC=CAM_ASM_001110 /TAXON_ID=97495 /ORGANISM="Imantonia sp., Strain RCC918" /LENGTH=228 /DNA_ID=CAMNT_0053596525 /DNA_START=19 /DNA_END=702 /DNA_ORIENTATION=-
MNINDISVSRECVGVKLGMTSTDNRIDPQNYYIVVSVVGDSKVSVRPDNVSHDTVLKKGEQLEVKSGGYISLHGTNKTYQYQFEVIPYTLDKLKRKEKKLEAELNLIRTLINQKEKETKKKLSTPTKKRDRRSAGVEENVQVQPPRKIPVNFNANTYSLKGLTDYAHHYCGIVTKNLPEEYSMCFENNGSTKGLSTNQRVQQNGDIQFWTGESNDAKPIIGYNKSERW